MVLTTRLLGPLRSGLAVGAAALLVAGCTDLGPETGPGVASGEPTHLGEPTHRNRVGFTPDRSRGSEMVSAALAELPGDVETVMERTGVPGVAVAVVHEGEVVFAEGFGLRELGRPEAVDADTVFQIASLSKPVGSTVMASLVGDRVIAWDDPVQQADPSFELADPWVSEHVTYADLYSHRSGLPEHAGDLLEDLGYDRAEVIERLRHEPLTPIRASYAYTNFGLTAAAQAAATASGTTWEDASRQRLYDPLGMDSTSSTFEDFAARSNRATGHVLTAPDGEFVVTHQQRRPDAQSPAGGVSSTASDLAKWMLLQVDAGVIDGEQVIDADALAETHLPQAVSSPPPEPGARTGFYGLGFNVGYDGAGRLRLSHSGAFALGAGTATVMLPSKRLGIVVLTNGAPVGAAESIAETFMERATIGETSRDWPEFTWPMFMSMLFPEPSADYDEPSPDATPPKTLATYVGTYGNDWLGDVEVSEVGGGLVVTIGPDAQQYPLRHYDGDVFSWQFAGENAGSRSAVTFAVDGDGPASSVTLETFDANGLGTLPRT